MTEKGAGFSREVHLKEARKLKARRRGAPHVWSGLGMIGLIGWSVVAPTLLGAMLGMWLDDHYPSRHSWTLALLIAGVMLGCLNAWRWVAREEKRIREDKDEGL